MRDAHTTTEYLSDWSDAELIEAYRMLRDASEGSSDTWRQRFEDCIAIRRILCARWALDPDDHNIRI